MNDSEEQLSSLLAFQPVYAGNMDLQAFDLLVDDPTRVSGSLSDIEAFSRVFLEHYANVYREGELRQVPCFLPLGAEVLLDPLITRLPRAHYIIEVRPDVAVSEALCQRLRVLAGKGYRLATPLRENWAELASLLDIVHIVRVDLSRADWQEKLSELRAHGPDLMASGLGSPEQFRNCLEAGFRLFQGDILAKPEVAQGRTPGGNKLLLLQILGELDNPDSTIDDLEKLIIQDAALTYKFIKVVNSASFGIDREIDTLSHALAILGTRNIRSWVSMFLLEGHDDRPEELVRSMLVTGRMCEIVAEVAGREHAIRYFIMGLLSKLDVLTGIAMQDLMASVALNQQIKDALLSGSGSMGSILQEVEHYQDGQFDRLACLPDPAVYETAYRHSTAWAQQLQSALYGQR